MDVVTALLIITMMLIGLNLASVLVLRYLVTNLYLHVREERDALMRGRDGWRDVAERLIVVARTNEGQVKRAAQLAAMSTPDGPPS